MHSRNSAARRTAGRLKRWLESVPARLWFGTVVVAFAAVRPIIRLRAATFDPKRIGEFIQRIDMAIAMVNLDESAGSSRRRNYFVMPPVIANEQLRIMYTRSLAEMPGIDLLDCRSSLRGRLLIDPARRLARNALHHKRYRALYCGEGAVTMDSCGLRPSGRPLISFTAAEIELGWTLLEPMGILPTTRYVCLHIRDGAYLKQIIPEHDWSYHDYRNPPMESYVAMVEQVLDLDYSVVRMGKVVAGAFPIRHENFHDYALSSAKSDFLDVFLYAHATLAIAGSVSGIDQLSHAFNVPSIATDFVPFDDPRWAADSALIIPALIRDTGTGELLPLSRQLACRYGSSRRYEEAGLAVVPNSSAEITEVVLEGIHRLEGSWTESEESADRQSAFWAWAEACGLSEAIPPGPWDEDHYRARLGSDFLQKYSQLLFR